ncbi:methyl-accepting chemotaxis protein [Algicella marina]|uniref:Methyl-accepting transducer domain-containing protein n=1 Tax=Algicella marina TaxID=2683284 RepID=A0A6P1T3W0_9RHOB|nr:methyl-accepting chemotaxis protein [Algicella marina]QHQ36435.1 hypothetical protein GO499_15250 [Algicella marina]
MAATASFVPENAFPQIKAVVGPVRSIVFEGLALLMSKPAAEFSDEDVARVENCSEVLRQASDMLDKDIPTHFGSGRMNWPAELKAAVASSARLISEVNSRLRTALDGAREGREISDSLRSLLTFTQTKMRPEVDTLFDMLTTYFNDHSRQTAADDRELIKSAMQQIDNISMSINLISLNASVEAARAGEAGKGFAVIAAEIQSLSSESKKAVDSIRQRLA